MTHWRPRRRSALGGDCALVLGSGDGSQVGEDQLDLGWHLQAVFPVAGDLVHAEVKDARKGRGLIDDPDRARLVDDYRRGVEAAGEHPQQPVELMSITGDSARTPMSTS